MTIEARTQGRLRAAKRALDRSLQAPGHPTTVPLDGADDRPNLLEDMTTEIRDLETAAPLPRPAVRSYRSLHEILNSVRASMPVAVQDALPERGSSEDTSPATQTQR